MNATALRTRESIATAEEFDPSWSDRLDDLVVQALRASDIDGLLFSNRGFFPHVMTILSRTLELAFGQGDESARRQVHGALFRLYEENFRHGHGGSAVNQFHPFIMRVRNDIERAWERFECGRIDVALDAVPADEEGFSDFFRHYCAGHRLTGHPLFDFIERQATRAEIVRFFAYDSTLVLRFCDLITLAMIGADDEVRGVLAENFWDEMGNGDFSRRHTFLFKRLLRYVGADQVPAAAIETSWQGLAGFNLYMYLSLHRRNYFMSLGCLGSGELMDASQYAKIVKGCERVGFTDRAGLSYYIDHAEADVRHGNEWLDKVLVPLAGKHDGARRDILTGASLRLNATADYYDFLLEELSGTAGVVRP
ncbi:MAG TPA: iron-containing redox enzyme family protein [Dongiaceae bacterium]|jgi:pyrroloquinoline quinone (PQQ) biosynthesis protein C|nr:iron-containing redox enzyme family protein [Dongiaceae bacterium]